jgi:anti-sigma regulatory factor (Ser/Thr protein kinase)
VIHFTVADLRRLREAVARVAAAASLDEVRAADLALAVDELATNSICHGGGEGVMRLWRDEDALVCEVQDGGHIAEPWIRHMRPGPDLLSGRGLWLVEQMCDLVQVQSSPRTGSIVRIKMLLGSPARAYGV